MPKMNYSKVKELIALKKSAIVDTDPCNVAGRRSEEANAYVSEISCIKKAKYALATAHFAPNPEGIKRDIYRRFPELHPRYVKEFEMAKKTGAQKKVKKVIKEYKKGELNIIALSEAGKSKKKRTKSKRKKKK